MNKYELTNEIKTINGHTLRRIKALKDYQVNMNVIKKTKNTVNKIAAIFFITSTPFNSNF